MSDEERWTAPVDNSLYICDDGRISTRADLTEGIEPEFLPSSREDYDTLLFCHGAAQILP